MTRDEARECGKLMVAWGEGKTVQTRLKGHEDEAFTKAANPAWDFYCFDYRIVPATTRRPWTPEEARGKGLRVKGTAGVTTIVAVNEDMYWVGGRCAGFAWAALNDKFENLDGSPIGVEVEA